MSLRTRIKGLTAWVNLRLMPHHELLNNVVMDLLTGTNMKLLIESLTGRNIKRVESFDGLSQVQKQTRVEWIIAELQECNVIPKDTHVDARLFAMRSTDHIFELLWRLISHDIWFVWERAEYLQQDDDALLCEVEFKWIPDPPPVKKKKKTKVKKSFLSGFGSASFVKEESDEVSDPDEQWIKFPGSEFCLNFKSKRRTFANYPTPEDCILELVNKHMKMQVETKKLHCKSLDDLVDSRVLCSLVNSFVPNTFNTDLLLNDRWTINIALRTAEKMFYANTPFDSEDLTEADHMAVSSYFCFFFMAAYKFRQCRAVVNRMNWLQRLIRECNHDLEKFPAAMTEPQDLMKSREIKINMSKHGEDLNALSKRFDLDFCQRWVQHVDTVQTEVRKQVRDKMSQRFDTIAVPRNISINELCLSTAINLNLTNGSGFCLTEMKEQVSESKRIVLHHKETGQFIDDFTGKKKDIVRKILKITSNSVSDVNPEDHPQYEIYTEAPSRNKVLKTGQVFLYQVFPGTTSTWQKLFLRAARDNESDTMFKMIVFFRSQPGFINTKEVTTGYTALHWACKNGHKDIVSLLLENGALIDARNCVGATPLNLAIENLEREISHMLIEWGCDVHTKNTKGQTIFETVKNEEFKKYLIDLYEYYSTMIPRLIDGDAALMAEVVENHVSGVRRLSSLTSRCVNGSTLLHTAAYHGHVDAVKDLLQLRIDVNLQDYKGASPLHRAKTVETMEALIEGGAQVDSGDFDGNTPLHVKCYGETGNPSESACIETLISHGANLTKRNSRGLLPIHCCAMQGRVDIINLMRKLDTNNDVIKALKSEPKDQPPSLVNLAIANDFINCAQWLLKAEYEFKDKEQDYLIHRILSEQIKPALPTDAISLLLDNGADINQRYPGGNTSLHAASSMMGSTDVLELLLSHNADVNAINDEHCTPLFCATRANNQMAACRLIEHGADIRHKNDQGLTAFDLIPDFEDWINSGYFSEEIRARLKAYNLKHARDLIRAISKKVKVSPTQQLGKSPSVGMLHSAKNSLCSLGSSQALKSSLSQNAVSRLSMRHEGTWRTSPPLPPIKPSAGYLMS